MQMGDQFIVKWSMTQCYMGVLFGMLTSLPRAMRLSSVIGRDKPLRPQESKISSMDLVSER
jgi:hypothetical protein